jgi:putative transposase
VQQTMKEKVSWYTMKMRIYPSAEQAKQFDRFFLALQLAYNMTFHEVFLKNPNVCQEKEGVFWPDYEKMGNSAWRKKLIENKPIIAEVPAVAIENANGLFRKDAKKAWETGMHNLPVNKVDRKDFRFYNVRKPRRSFVFQLEQNKLTPSDDNPKVAWIKVPKVSGQIKARGFNRKIWFGPNGTYTYKEAVEMGKIAKKMTARISKDTCGDYYISITFYEGNKKEYDIYRETRKCAGCMSVGLDVGVKDIAILSNGKKYENKHFKEKKKKSLIKMNRQLSRRWGLANSAFRDYNKEIREENKSNDDAEDKKNKELAKPSKGYLKIQKNHAKLERRIARQRETTYHQMTAEIVKQANFIGVETLYVKNMMKNHRLAYALGDAAMSDFISKLKYKAARSNIPLVACGMFEPTSQMCSVCGEINPKVKNLSVREWTCPRCGTHHDRDINAAKNILTLAQKTENSQEVDKEEKTSAVLKKKIKKPPRNIVFIDNLDIVICFSRELTRNNDPRYVILNKKTNVVIDDAQGVGYRSISKARNCFKAKIKWSQKMTK